VIGFEPAAVLFGVAIAFSGWMGTAALAVRHRERIRGRLGESTKSGPGSADDHGRSTRLGRMARRRGWRGDPRLYVAASLSLLMLGAVLGWRLAGPVGSVAGAVAGGGAIEWRLARHRARRRESIDVQLREAVMALAAAVRAGLSVVRALEEAVRDSEEPLRSALEGVLRRVEVGEPLEEALAGLATDLGSSEAGLLVTALSVHRRSGGELPAMLEEVAEIIRQRVDARRQVRALTAQGRASGAVLAVLPVAFVTLLSGTSGDGLGAFYRTPLGAVLLLAGLTCEALGFLWIRRIVRAGP
jgi:tight adherence protein B